MTQNHYCMQNTKELDALFSLIDDPDMEVYETVSERITGFGKAIIPNLENLWENSPNYEVQARIEALIHALQFNDLQKELTEWKNSLQQDLFQGALLVARYQFPDLHTSAILQDIEKIRRNVWLELNSYLTPLEQANVLSSILYNYYNLNGTEVSYNRPNDFFINKVLASRKGNSISNGILYKILCNLLDIKAYIINIPKHLIIAFYRSGYTPDDAIDPEEKIYFFVDGTTGHAFSHNDIKGYLKRMNMTPKPLYYEPLTNAQVIQMLLRELGKCYQEDPIKQAEIATLAALLND